jgi:ligand-binding sensor domain-containing protein
MENIMYFNNLRYKGKVTGTIIRSAVIIILMILITPDVKCQQAESAQPFGEGITAKRFHSSTIDDNNVVWFLTETGIVSFNGTKWTLHNKNRKVPAKDLRHVIFDFSSYGPELWIANPTGATVVSTPVDARSGATTYYLDNSKILSENVMATALGKKELRWFGTEKGVSAFKGKKWLVNNYSRVYPEDIFKDYPVSSMATSIDGDSLYVGTLGGGVLRFYRNDVDAVSGASEYAKWGPILMPSDTVYCIHITPDGTQYIGTDKGLAKHSGYNTLEGWTVYDTASGLADDQVQALNSDSKGNLYIGTKNGLSVFDGKSWTTYRIENGLVSNNILTIAVGKNNVVWLGTENGVTCIRNGKFINYQ